MQYATSGVVAALLREDKPGYRGHVDGACSPFEDDEVTSLEHHPAVKRERSNSTASTLSSPPESSAEDDSGGEVKDESDNRQSKRQRAVKIEPGRVEAGPGPSTAQSRGKRKSSSKRG